MPKQLKKMDPEQRELLSLAHDYKYKCHKDKHAGEAYDFHKYRRLKKRAEALEAYILEHRSVFGHLVRDPELCEKVLAIARNLK